MAARIDAARVLTGDGFVGPATVVVSDDGRIAGVTAAAGPGPPRTIVPGFVDLQVNGIGRDAVGDPSADWERLDAALLAQGVTTWCPTLTSRARDEYGPALEQIDEARRRGGNRPAIAGAHLEGPFLDPGHARAHPVERLAPVDLPWLESLPDLVRIVTLAPELPGALDAIRWLDRRGIVAALGHSGADPETTRAAADAGATLVTHLFNAMAPLHHRRPGLAGAALAEPTLAVSLIADLVHLAPEILQVAFAAKGAGRVAIVTDAVATDVAGGHSLEVVDGAPRLGGGTIAGSVLTMDRAVRNLVGRARVSLDDAVTAASSTPARLLGFDDRGRVEPGRRADLVAFHDDLSIESVWVAGVEVAG